MKTPLPERERRIKLFPADSATKKSSVLFGKARPLLGQVIEREDGRHRAYRYARATIDTFYRIDVNQLFVLETRVVFLRVNTIHRARVHTSRIFSTYAGFGDNVCHAFKLTQRLQTPKISRARGRSAGLIGDNCRPDGTLRGMRR
jgi:hypothetical protein